MKDIARMFARSLIAPLVCWCILCVPVYAESNAGIIIPELRAPFDQIFEAVADGIEKELGHASVRLILEKNYSPIKVTNWLRANDIDSVITLGSRGKKAAAYFPQDMPVVLGGLLSAPSPTNPYPGLALTPEPGAMFGLLKELDPTRAQVIVVYNPLKYQWLIDIAKRQAVENGVQLVEYEATDLKRAAIIYNEILSRQKLDKSALWLLQDRTVIDSRVVLPFILERSWQKDMMVFSSALGHVSKGVLFAMYPNNELHGQQLAKILKNIKAGKNGVGNRIYPSTGLHKAINSRTAEHLGIKKSISELREYDVVFPVSN